MKPPKKLVPSGKQMINKNLSGYSYRPQTAGLPAEQKLPRTLKRRPSWKKALISFLLLILLFVVVWILWVGIAVSKNSQKIFGSGNLLSLLSNSPLDNQNGRVNILLAGYSADDPGHSGANLTDSIMLISLNTKKHTGYMLSIPRDLYVDIPGFDHARINEAYQDGGMGLLEKVVSQNLNVAIDYYALINYAALRDSVNAVGGITINIQSPDPRGLYDPNIDYSTGGSLVNLSNGWHTLNGEQALDLARARGDPSEHGVPYGFPQSDFDRTQHQRQMLSALANKAANFHIIANPIRVGKLFSAMGSNVKTDLKLNNLISLYQAFHGVKNSNLQSVGLNNANGKDLLTGYVNYYGEDVQIPAAGIDNYQQIDDYISSLNAQ